MADVETNTAEMIDLGDTEEKEQQTEAAEEEAEVITSNPNDEEEAKENQSSEPPPNFQQASNDLQQLKDDLKQHEEKWAHLGDESHGIDGFVRVQPAENDLGEFGVSTNGISMPNLKKCCNPDVRVRFARWSFMSFVPIIFLAVLTNNSQRDGAYSVSLSFYVGFALQIMYIAYFSMIFYLFWSGHNRHKDELKDGEQAHLFRILTKTGKVRGWASMNIAGEQVQYKYTAIQSISEFSAIDGGVASIMLANLGPFTWAVTVMNFAAQIQCFGDFSWDIADICEIVGVTGLVMIGLFELDPHNKSMKRFHYLGALAGSGTVLGFVIQGWSLTNAASENPEYFDNSFEWTPSFTDTTNNGNGFTPSPTIPGGGGYNNYGGSVFTTTPFIRRLRRLLATPAPTYPELNGDGGFYYSYNYDWESYPDTSGGGYLILPIIIALICLTLFISWQFIFNKCTTRYENKVTEEVNREIVRKYQEVINENESNPYPKSIGVDLIALGPHVENRMGATFFQDGFKEPDEFDDLDGDLKDKLAKENVEIIKKKLPQLANMRRDDRIEAFLPDERKKDISACISKWSLANVVSEAIFLFCGATALCVYLMQYDLGCCTGCSHKGGVDC